MAKKKTGERWGETKPVFEEGLIGGLVVAAVGLTVAAIFLPSGALPGFLARWGMGLFPTGQSLNAYSANEIRYTATGVFFLWAGVMGFLIGFFELVRQESQWHWDGMEFLSDPAEGREAMQANENALMSDLQKNVIPGVEIGGVEFSRTREVAHFSLVGLPGAGKTVIANGIVKQVLERGDKLLLHDPKGDFTAWVFNPESAVLLGPWDARARFWDVAKDISTPEMATTFAGAMFRDDGGANQYFSDAAREALAGVIKSYMRLGKAWSWDTLASDLSKGIEHIVGLAHEGDPQTKMLLSLDENGGAGNGLKGVLSELAKSTSWIPAYAAAFDFTRNEYGILDTRKGFSFKEWFSSDENADYQEVQTVIFNNNKNYEVRAQQIFGAMMAAASNYLNSSDMPEISADEPGYWVILDEYPQLGSTVSKYVQAVEEMGRSRGVRVVKAVQDESQLFAQVGREKGEAQRSVQQTRVYAKLATGTAAEIAQRLGQRDVIRVEFPQAVGAGNKRATTVQLPVIRADDLTGLRVLKDPDAPQQGVEIVVHCDDILVKLVNPFTSVNEHCPKVIDNDKWKRGVLGVAPAAAAATAAETDDADIPAFASIENEAMQAEGEGEGEQVGVVNFDEVENENQEQEQ